MSLKGFNQGLTLTCVVDLNPTSGIANHNLEKYLIYRIKFFFKAKYTVRYLTSYFQLIQILNWNIRIDFKRLNFFFKIFILFLSSVFISCFSHFGSIIQFFFNWSIWIRYLLIFHFMWEMSFRDL